MSAPSSTQIRRQLDEIAESDDFGRLAYGIVEAWESAGAGLEAIEPILWFMEQHPLIDLGSPGALVHFVEQFYRKGYEELLLASIQRQATPHTIWMLNRLINGADGDTRSAYLSTMRRVAHDPSASAEARATALEFLDFQSRDRP